MPDNQIRETLLSGGWDANDVERALGSEIPNDIRQPEDKITNKPLNKNSNMKKSTVTITIVAGLAIAGYFASAYYFNLYPFQTTETPIPTFTPRPSATPQVNSTTYRNDQFGFYIALPDSWKGYTVNQIKEDIYDVSGLPGQGKTKTNNGVVDSFQLIELHHPLDTAQNPREVMPIMIFTPTQWAHIQNEEWSVGAAPIPPSLLGQNSKWIMALPARYNYDYKTGWEEVDQLVHTLKAFELSR